jgi:autotransporter-associated beta strand protein
MKYRNSIHRILAGPAFALALLSLVTGSQAATITWDGATNTWNSLTSWVGSIPITGDSMIFGTTGLGGLSLNNDLTSGSFNVAGITFTSVAGAFVIGDGTATPNAGNTFVLTGTVTNASGNLQTLNTPFTMTAVRTFTGGTNIALAGNISGSGGGISKGGSNTLILSGTNNYTGQTTVTQGVLRLDSVNAVPGGIADTGGTSNININGGVIGLNFGNFTRGLNTTATVSAVTFSGNGGWAAFGGNHFVNLGGLGASVNWTTGNTGLNSKILILSHPTADSMVDFQNPLDMLAVARTVQVDNGSAAIDGKLSGNITGIALGNLSKTGFGTLQLTGTNNYVGTTTVSAGTLLVDGTNSGAGAVTVSSGASLGGIGNISAAVTASAGGRINLRDGAVGNLTLGSSLTLSGTAAIPNNLYFDLGNGMGGTDKIVLTTGAHAAATLNGALVNLNQLSGIPVEPGTYTLIQGGATSTFTGYTLATTRAGRNLYSALGANVNDLQVTVAAGDPGPADAFSYWQGDTTIWNTAQWYSNDIGTITAVDPGYSSNVKFGTTTAANLTNTLGQDYEINSLTVDAGLAATNISGNMLTLDATADNSNTLGNGITVNNAAGTTIASKVGLANSQTWTVDTGAALAVSGVVSDFGGGYALTKAGAGTLTLSGVNTFNGPLTVSAGTLAIGGAGQLNSGTYGNNILNNGTLSFTSTANQNLNGIISGTGALTKSGGGILTLGVANTYSGDTTISSGSILLNTTNTLVPSIGTGAVTINSGGKLTLSAGFGSLPVTIPNALTLNGGTLALTGGNSASTYSGSVNLAANSTVDGTNSNFEVNPITGAISGVGGLTKTGIGTIKLTSSSNNYDGPTVVSAGSLWATSSLYGNDTSKWTPANITVANNALLSLSVGGTGEFTIAQAETMFTQLATSVDNNGLRPGSFRSVDTRNAPSGTITYSAVLADSTGTGGGAVNFKLFGSATTTLELTGANTYSGLTMIENNGTLRVSSFNSVATNVGLGTVASASSSLGAPTTVANGTIWLGAGGYPPGNSHPGTTYQGAKLVYTGSGETTDRVLNIGGANNSTYTLDQSGSGLLKFISAMTATENRGPKTITLQGATAGTAEFAGVIPNIDAANPNRLTKAGTGTWTLSGANAFVGITTVNGGALVLANAEALKGGIGATGGLGALTFNGGVIGLGAGDFARPLAAAGIVGAATFTGNGGWAAYGADRVVNLGGLSAPVTWATASTGLNGKTLILGNITATHMVDLQNPLDLGAAVRTVQVDNGAATIDGTLSGILSGTGGALTKTGAGTLALNAINGYTAGTTVSDGTLQLGAAGSIATSSSINLAKTAVLDTTAQSFTMLGTQPVTFNIDPAAAGASGRIKAAALDITAAVVTFTASATLDDPVYILADYTSLTGSAFASVTPLTGNLAGYIINYAYNGGTQIALTLPGGYNAWALTNAGGQAANLDFDNDGVLNGVEYFMGQTGSTFTPNPSVVGGKVTWPYDATTTGITYKVLSSTDLSSWAPVSPQPVPSGGTLEYILPTTGPKLFIRLEVVVAP